MYGSYDETSNFSYILGQKRNAKYKTYIVYGGLSSISRKRFVTVYALILGLWVPGIVLAIIVTGRNTITYVFIDLDVALLGDEVMNAHGLTLFQFVKNVS